MRVAFTCLSDGTVMVRRKLSELAGILGEVNDATFSVEQTNR